jgi:hypothetical protein
MFGSISGVAVVVVSLPVSKPQSSAAPVNATRPPARAAATSAALRVRSPVLTGRIDSVIAPGS